MRAMRSVCQMLAQTSPLMNSSSFRYATGVPRSLTTTRRLLSVSRIEEAQSAAGVPSLRMSRVPSCVSPSLRR
jgi:hypothetical protein